VLFACCLTLAYNALAAGFGQPTARL